MPRRQQRGIAGGRRRRKMPGFLTRSRSGVSVVPLESSLASDTNPVEFTEHAAGRTRASKSHMAMLLCIAIADIGENTPPAMTYGCDAHTLQRPASRAHHRARSAPVGPDGYLPAPRNAAWPPITWPLLACRSPCQLPRRRSQVPHADSAAGLSRCHWKPPAESHPVPCS